jgi:hypothetical protein
LVLLQRLLERAQFDAAAELAQQRGLSLDAVHAVQFDTAAVTRATIELHLAAIDDLEHVLLECISRVGESEAAQRALLHHGLQLTVPSMLRSTLGDAISSSSSSSIDLAVPRLTPLARDLCLYRVVLLSHLDRLDT